MRFLFALMLPLLASALAAKDPRAASFSTLDGGKVHGNLYGDGPHGVVLAHGMVFNKESWEEQARRLAAEGFQALAIDFRGYGGSTAGSQGKALELDVLAAIAYLREHGAERVSVVGGSMGGAAAAKAAALAEPGTIEALVLLAPAGVDQPEKLQGRKLFVVSEGDGFHQGVVEAYGRAPEPKKLVVVEGSAHAQHLFKTEQGPRVLDAIVEWLRGEP
jgi:pimeloyl-ACP methyl ester carboxylesterase